MYIKGYVPIYIYHPTPGCTCCESDLFTTSHVKDLISVLRDYSAHLQICTLYEMLTRLLTLICHRKPIGYGPHVPIFTKVPRLLLPTSAHCSSWQESKPCAFADIE
jgi:hypothetical protein